MIALHTHTISPSYPSSCAIQAIHILDMKIHTHIIQLTSRRLHITFLIGTNLCHPGMHIPVHSHIKFSSPRYGGPFMIGYRDPRCVVQDPCCPGFDNLHHSGFSNPSTDMGSLLRRYSKSFGYQTPLMDLKSFHMGIDTQRYIWI